MGKRVDLNEKRDNSSPKEPSALRKKVAVEVANKMGVPKELMEEYVNNPEMMEKVTKMTSKMPGGGWQYDKEKGKMVIKLPLSVKFGIIIVVVIAIMIFLLVFVVLFGNEATTKSVNAKYALGQTCEQISVYDTENSQYDSNKLSFYDYIAGVVAAESEGSTDSEYLKLLAIVARTYFLANVDSSCEVKGNEEFQKYMAIGDSPNKNIIEKAVTDTQDLVIVENGELINSEHCTGCLINTDDNYYYIRYKGTEVQEIPKNWVDNKGLTTKLDTLYSEVNTEEEYEKRNCPNNNSDGALSKIGAQYLIDNDTYTYENTIKYYFGENIEIIENEIIFLENGEYINPVSSINCTSLYGERTHPVDGTKDFHYGVDLGISGGSPIYAVKSGKITRVEKDVTIINGSPEELPGDKSYGNYIIIEHENGISTLYAHMEYGSISESIQVGDIIEQGDVIGKVGSTGVSTGNHLHYEVRENNSNVDPLDYLDLTDATGYCAN